MRERNEGSGNTGARSKRRLRLWLGSGALLSVLAGLSFALFASPAALSRAELDARYAEPLPPPSGPLRVFHLGHSLVGRDMPAMLAELAGNGHRYESALGWGATLKGHWGDAPVAGAARENAHPRFRDAGEAADSGDYDAFVLTEMVEFATPSDIIRALSTCGVGPTGSRLRVPTHEFFFTRPGIRSTIPTAG